jgi:hypothetical protein
MGPSLLRTLDEFARVSLQDSRNTFFDWLLISTALVLIGVVFEETDVILTFKWVRRCLPVVVLVPAHRLESWAKAVSIIGWAVLLIGVVGEGAFEGLVSEADGWLQEFNNILSSSQQSEIKDLGDITAQARKDATEASKAAWIAKTASQLAIAESKRAETASANAIELARGARQEADSFAKDITDAKRDASEAKALLAEVRQLASEAQIRSTNAETQAEEATRRTSDRVITDGQRYRMLMVLRSMPSGQQILRFKIAPRRKIVVESLLSEGGEALKYAFMIAGVFNTAGWDVTEPRGIGSFNEPLDGALIIVGKDGVEPELIDLVARALIVGGAGKGPIPVLTDNAKPNGALEVWIGRK